MDGEEGSGAIEADALAAAGLREAAIAAYVEHLARWPDDWRARLALGACLEGAGDAAAALGQYREAAAVAPQEAAPQRRIAEVLRALGETTEAVSVLKRVRALDPPVETTHLALGGIAPRADAATDDAQAARIVFDASDLVAYFEDNRAPTGIQRVQVNVIARALLDATPEEPIAVCAFNRRDGGWRAIPREVFLRLWHLSRTGADPRDLSWQAALAELREVLSGAPELAFAAGAVLCNLGTSWWIEDYFLRIRDAQARFGLRYVPFVHDCIPLIVPRHCAEPLVREFAQWFASLALHADAVLCNSRCTENDLRRMIAALSSDLTPPPSTVVPLDADLRQEFAAGGAVLVAGSDDPRLPAAGEPFALCVGTIESRKDHLLLFSAWHELIRRHGAASVPRLVCIGKPGWLAEPALALLAGTPELAARVLIVHGVSDTALSGLYGRCLFTVYNSHYEGWGLPVTESLSYGRVPVIPRHSALVESGAEGAVFFAPGDVDDLVAKLEPLLFDQEARAAAEARIARHVRLRSWSDIKDAVLAALRGLPPRRQLPRIALRSGQVAELRLLGGSSPSPAMALADTARRGLRWHRLESWGVWTRPGRAVLTIPLEVEMGDSGAAPLRLHLDCVAPPRDLRVRLRLGPEDMPGAGFLAEAGTRFTHLLDLPPGLRVLELEIDSGDEGVQLGGHGERLVGLGLARLMVCRRDDLVARLEFLEGLRVAFRPPGAG